mgnify:CR=1 FL=1
MAESIKVSTSVLKETAGKVRGINAKLDEQLASINKKMNDLESSWSSDAGRDIRANMNALKPRFEDYKKIVESYANFLDETAATYEETEQIVQQNASQFR